MEVPSLFPYTDNKMVPWSYNCNYVNESVAANILRIEGITRSGRCYATTIAKRAPPKPVEELPKQKKLEVTPDVLKESVIEKKASGFLKFIKHSEYSVVEKLNKLPTHISLLAFLLNSKPHRNALMTVLNEAYVAHNISVEKVD